MPKLDSYVNPASMPFEMTVLLACLKDAPAEEKEALLRQHLQCPIHWHSFLGWVDRHRVAPLVYSNLHVMSWKNIPEWIRLELQERYRANTSKALALAAELVRLMHLLEKEGLEALPLKGTTQALDIFGDIGLRHAGDIDLLTRLEDCAQVDRLLRANGYRLSDPAFGITTPNRNLIINKTNQIVYVHTRKGLKLELHWRLFNYRFLIPLDWNALQREARAVPIAGHAIAALGAQHMMHNMFVHGSKHFWFRLFWLCDVARVLRKENGFDWTGCMATADTLGTARAVGFGALLSHLLLGSQIPPAILHDMCCDRVLHRLVHYALEQILDPDPWSNVSTMKIIKREQHILRLTKSWRYKLDRLLLLLRPTQADLAAVRLPPVFAPLYYILRPLFLIRRHLFRYVSKTTDVHNRL